MLSRTERNSINAAKSYIYDGYHLAQYYSIKTPLQWVYILRHPNDNEIKVIGDETDKKVYIYLNNKLNKTIE